MRCWASLILVLLALSWTDTSWATWLAWRSSYSSCSLVRWCFGCWWDEPRSRCTFWVFMAGKLWGNWFAASNYGSSSRWRCWSGRRRHRCTFIPHNGTAYINKLFGSDRRQPRAFLLLNFSWWLFWGKGLLINLGKTLAKLDFHGFAHLVALGLEGVKIAVYINGLCKLLTTSWLILSSIIAIILPIVLLVFTCLVIGRVIRSVCRKVANLKETIARWLWSMQVASCSCRQLQHLLAGWVIFCGHALVYKRVKILAVLESTLLFFLLLAAIWVLD